MKMILIRAPRRRMEAGTTRPRELAAIRVFLCLLLAGAAAAWTAAPAAAVVVSGSSRTSVYTQESRVGAADFGDTGDLSGRTQLLEHLRLDVLGLGSPGLSFHTAVSARNILTDQSIGDTRFRFYRGYLKGTHKNGLMRYEARLGRQWVMAGVGSGLVDGIYLRAVRSELGEVTGFFGTLGTDRIASTDKFWSLDSPGDSFAGGGRIRYRNPMGILRPDLGLSLVEIQRTPHEERVADSRRLGFHGSLRFQSAEADSRPGFLDKLRIYVDLRRELLDTSGRERGNISSTAGLELFCRASGLRTWLEYNRRRPNLRSTSVFASFHTEERNELRGGFGLPITETIRADIDGDLIIFEDDEEAGVALMLSGYGLSAGYRFHGGYGGDLSGIVIYGHREITDKVMVDLSVNHTVYEYGESDPMSGLNPVDDTATTGIAAVGYRLLPRLTLTGQVEAMENARFNHDVRFLGTAQWRFRTAL